MMPEFSKWKYTLLSSQVEKNHEKVPQEGVLVPVFLNIYVQDTSFIHVDLLMFADDTIILVRNKDLNLAAEKLQTAADGTQKFLLQ